MASLDNTGGLWQNTKRDRPKAPDFIGQVTIDGKTHYLSGWYTDGKNRKPKISMRVNQSNAPIQKTSTTQYNEPPKDFDDDIPF